MAVRVRPLVLRKSVSKTLQFEFAHYHDENYEMASKEWKDDNQEKMKTYRNDWYERNKITERKKAKERQAERRLEFKKWFSDFKKTLKCSKCGFNHPAALDFHHENPNEKEYDIAYLRHHGSKEKILKEIEKCVVLCANCHRIHHFDK